MKYISIILIFLTTLSYSQRWNSDSENKSNDPIVQSIVDEANNNSQLEILAHELFDVIGPRLVGTPQMQQAHDWAVKKYNEWGIEAYNHEWGKWRGWERGITHIDMIEPRLRTLSLIHI